MISTFVERVRPVWNWLVRPEQRHDEDQLHQATRVAAFSLAMFVWVVVFTLVYDFLAAPISSAVVLSAGALLTIILVLLQRGFSPALCGHILCAAAIYTYTTLALLNGGLTAPATMWFASVPVLAMLLLNTGAAILWTAASLVVIAALAAGREAGFHYMLEVTPLGLRVLQVSGLMGLVTCICMLVAVLKKVERSAKRELHEANARLERQATTDGLTGITNRRGFDRLLDEEWRRHQRLQLPLSLALIDADLFKQFNDVCGHLAGDDCLRAIAEVIQSSLRRGGDVAARFGGEEFAIILPNTGEDGAFAIAEQIRLRIKMLSIPHPRSTINTHVTISIGLATITPRDGESVLDVLREADAALYRAKANGRDQTIGDLPRDRAGRGTVDELMVF
jgi:diguanylate cyclase (GGDEF)-like protein